MRHAARAGDGALLADLAGRWGPWLAGRGEPGPAAGAVSAARAAGPGDAAEPRDARLAVVAAHVHLARGEHDGARAALRRARRDRSRDPDAHAFLVATERVLGRRTSLGPRATSEPAPTEPAPTEPALAAHVRVGRGAAALLAGDAPRARTELGAGLAAAHRLGLEVLAHRGRALLAAALWLAGDGPRAREAADRVVGEHGADGPALAPWTAVARAVAAHAALLRADPAAARATPHDGGDLVPAVRFATRIARGGAAVDLGDRTAGLLELQAARAELGDTAVPGGLAAVAALLEHRAALALGHPTAAGAVAGWLAGRHPGSPALGLVRGWAAVAAGDPAGAREAVAPLLARRPRPTPYALDVEAWLLESAGRLARDDRPGARAAARQAVGLAAPHDVLRPFAHADAGVRALLVDELATGAPRAAFVARALAAGATSPAGIALSVREHDVLTRLPSLESLDEIAGDLDVSINTIKTHVRALYGKLGVTTRRDAVLVAHEQGLLG
ncbi:helix-turn-helix transcriptional regulator [Actinomycetospora aeridis]|uniref:Helix-turn-helix transcriptional regulator n=1 Tax=Actinomycetospora aeridis TaxID=3129231 RepID=A0ABU8NB56_9PSEU